MHARAVAAGGGGWALASGGAVALAGLPWLFAFGARWRLLDDALDGVPFCWRGDRAGIWATAPFAGALITLVRRRSSVRRWSSGSSPGCSARAAYMALFVWLERRYEETIMLDLTVLETRFERDHDHPHAAAADLRVGATG